MQYREFGKLGYKVSALGLGCMRLPRVAEGPNYGQVDREKAIELIRYAADHGINYFDTALNYHSFTSESVLGEALDGGYRGRVKVVTKQMLHYMTTQDDIRRNLEKSLKELRTDHVDIYLVHNIMDKTWDEIKRREIVKEYQKFKDEGLIGAIGFSTHGSYPVFKEIIDYFPWDMCQVQQNIMDVNKAITAQAISLAGEKGVPVVIMEPLRGGGLANAPAKVKAIYDSFGQERPPVEWAFRHIINYPEVRCILSGMTTLEQLKENIAIFSKPDAVPGCLSEREKEIISKVRETYESLAAIPCTGCEYCVPCPRNVNIPGIFFRYNEGVMFENFDGPKRMYMLWSGRDKADASLCVSCGACEKKCPQRIDIMNQLQVAHKALSGWVE